MKISEQWLRQWVTLDATTEEIVEGLTLAGLEVGGVEGVGHDDNILEIDLTPNRGDCLSVKGLSRELAVLFKKNINKLETVINKPTINNKMEVIIDNPHSCPSYACQIIKNINLEAKTPLWMQERLKFSGINPLSPVVDVTNYVMLELGQPMHAFSLSKIAGNIHVRNANKGESITLLNGKSIKLATDSLLIADDEKPLALAGVMGGEVSSVADTTTDILLESAFFTPLAIAGQARKYGLNTDSSHRFERGVDYQLQVTAINRACELLLEIVGGNCGPVNHCEIKEELPAHADIVLTEKDLKRLLGISIPSDSVVDILNRLGLKTKNLSSGWQVTVPSHRFDIKIKADLIEEVARVYGYANITGEQITSTMSFTPIKEESLELSTISDLLVNTGYQEIITYSFVNPEIQKLLTPDYEGLALQNPISPTLSVMRTTIWTGLLQTLLYNQNRQQYEMQLFETGLCFNMINNELVQKPRIAGLIAGNIYPENWATSNKHCDFYDLKAHVEKILNLTKNSNDFYFEKTKNPALQPGQAAEIKRNKNTVGLLGALHPNVLTKLDLKGPVFIFELDYQALSERKLPAFHAISKFPSIRRDVAILVDEQIEANKIKSVIQSAAGELLQDIRIFDVYRGENLEKNKKSIALGLTLQHQSRTLIDEDVNVVMTRVFKDLENKLVATIRE